MSGVPSEAYRIPRKVGFFGGSFNPPHFSHVLAVHYALLRWQFDFIVVAPTYEHPFEKDLVDFEHRVHMTRIAFEHLGSFVHILPIEKELPKPSYTWQTLAHIQELYPDSEVTLLIGSDLVAELPSWNHPEVIAQYPVCVIPRTGIQISGQHEAGVLPAASSSEIRNMLREGKDVSHLVPWRVLQYIREYELYTSNNA
jgi:nicotinate-nucleotide adenylyltransferase